MSPETHSGNPVALWSSQFFAPDKRRRAWRDLLQEQTPLDSQGGEDDLDVTLRVVALSPNQAHHRIIGGGYALQRDKRITPLDGNLTVTRVAKGVTEMTFGKRTEVLKAGDLMLYNPAQPMTSRLTPDSVFDTFTVEARHAEAIIGRGLKLDMVRVPAGSVPGRLAETVFAETMALSTRMTSHTFGRTVAYIADLLSGPDHRAPGGSVDAALLMAIKQHVQQAIGEHELSLAEVAVRHGVSPRRVQRLFAAEEATFGDYVMEQRLKKVSEMLTDPTHGGRLIVDIAFEAGFGDLSYFNRRFRARFGMTPGEWRSGRIH